MGLRINTNVQALAAQRSLGVNSSAQKASLEKLSSGSRIVRSADDAAGLAISEKMKSHIRSITQDIRNANDGISLVQTAEGAMNETGNILTRFRELSIQAASDTIGDVERGFIDKEVKQLSAEIDRIANTTEFNGRKLLAGEGEKLEIQVGLRNDATNDRFVYDTQRTNTTNEALGMSGISVATKEQAQNNLEKIDAAFTKLSENRAEMGAIQNRLVSTVNNMQIYRENLSEGNSRIRDVDMATETSELAKQNILTQATTSVLGQANQNTALALKLIG
jgi:flagellin